MATTTPVGGVTSYIQTGGVSVLVANGGFRGGTITNPMTSADQGIPTDPEPIYIDPVGMAATCNAGGTISRIEPGQTYSLIPNQSTPTYVNAPTSGHKFTVVLWL